MSGGPTLARRRRTKKVLARWVSRAALSLHTNRSEKLRPSGGATRLGGVARGVGLA